MARRASLRASDADREHATRRLQEATTEGRLGHDELEQRVELALSARTYGELDTVLGDLPGAGREFRTRRRRERREPTRRPAALWVALAAPVLLAISVAAVLLITLAVTGIFAGWVLWLVAGWWFFGRRRRRFGRYVVHGCRGHAGPHGPADWRGEARLDASRGSWV
jgi:hypothetical protein